MTIIYIIYSKFFIYSKSFIRIIKKTKSRINVEVYSYIKNVFWEIKEKKRFYSFLEDRGIKNVQVANKKNWKLGKRYFQAKCNNKFVFIKSGGNLNLVKREVDILRKLYNNNNIRNFLPNIIAYDENDKYFFIAEEYIEGIAINKNQNISKSKKVALEEQLFSVLQEMYKMNIHHLDLKPDNILITKNGIKIIDFGMSFQGHEDDLIEINRCLFNKIDKLNIFKTLGDGYNPQQFYWDDAYSLLIILNEFDKDLIINNHTIWEKLNCMIGSKLICVKERDGEFLLSVEEKIWK